jgi:hypothetical protein
MRKSVCTSVAVALVLLFGGVEIARSGHETARATHAGSSSTANLPAPQSSASAADIDWPH